jgi:hypothetical protein
MKSTERKPGRPVLPDDQRKGRVVKFRSRGDLVAKIQEAAAASGPVSQEIEHRLQQSFELAAQVKSLNEMLDGMVARSARQGRVVAGWIADELRSRGLDEGNTKELTGLIRDYFGRGES